MLSGKFFAIASAILIAAVNASPAEVAKRVSPGDVYFCAGSGWVEPCTTFEVDSNICYNFLGDVDSGLNSFRPNDGVSCTVYSDYQCTGNNTLVVSPGDGQFSAVTFENGVSSFSCS